ncbi:histidine kinase [Hymenobacter edaphi]|uniref:Histidine kinase/HSP90-like ATPase domain-containing protein n=1 Tax=Hymenobacter edaphi TaxID=2211146 RepID=A0A328BYX5_9BACT|nr:histidine kinase [Hymenobacter edaphi]RAK70338.1 hypothetical protein DLM85_05710 [Hymenobacter edaphi]
MLPMLGFLLRRLGAGRGRLLRVAGLGLWLGLLAPPARAQYISPAQTDSLRQLRRWPRATQHRLARLRASRRSGPVAQALLRRPELPPPLRVDLLLHLADYSFLMNRPSSVVVQLLEARQLALATPDSARWSRPAAGLSYAYSLLQQPERALFFGREAVRTAGGPDRLHLQLRAYGMLAIAAEQARDYTLALRCHRQVLRRAQLRRDSVNEAICRSNIVLNYLHQQRLPEAARELDTVRALSHVLDAPEREGIPLLTGMLAQRQGRHQAAVQALLPTLRAARRSHTQYHELEVLRALIPALSGLGRYREALQHQQRLTELQDSLHEERTLRQGQELQTLYETERRERELARQRQRISSLHARDQQREAELDRRTFLFVAVLVGGGLLLILALVRQRARHLLNSTAAALRMRTRIAADLHDEVGTLLTRVNLQAELLRQTQPQADAALERLLANSRHAASTMRDIVWGIDAEADTVGALLDRMRDHLDQTAPPAGLATELHVHGLRDEEYLPPELRQHLYLIFKEAVSNAARHARGATELRVGLERLEGHLRLRVADDGAAPAVPSGRSGLGLRSMQQRATALRGTLSTGPGPERGFLVELLVPH